jgi:hypothetical protein
MFFLTLNAAFKTNIVPTKQKARHFSMSGKKLNPKTHE